MDLDQGGNGLQFVKTWLGPTIGWVMLPVMPETFVTTGPTYTIQANDSRVLLNSTGTPVTTVRLPNVTTWVNAPVAQPTYANNLSSFDRSLWIKDFAYLAQANPITVTPFAGQFIDGLASFQMINNGELIRLYPLTNLTGWFVG